MIEEKPAIHMADNVPVSKTISTDEKHQASIPTSEFLNQPLHVVYYNGMEGTFDNKVTVSNFVNYAFNQDVKKSWKKVDESMWSLLVNVKDKLTGQETEISFALVTKKKPDRVILHRLLVNGIEVLGLEKDTFVNYLVFDAAEKMKN